MSDGDIEYRALFLRRGQDRRLRGGHLWVFANEVDVKRSPLTDFQTGEACVIADAQSKPLGVGYVNPHALICARLVNRGIARPLDASLLVHRIKVALSLRERLYPGPFYRLLHAEADGVPGLVVDRFDDVLVAQALTAGIENRKDDVEQALVKVLKPRAVLWREDAPERDLEGLPHRPPSGGLDAPIRLQEAGLQFALDPLDADLSRWPFELRDGRDWVAPKLKGLTVLDLFAGRGAWSLRVAQAGAASVEYLDHAAAAATAVARNAADNGLQNLVGAVGTDVFEHLRRAREERRHFDAVIVDPPAFIHRRKEARSGREKYRQLNEMAIQVLSRDGLLVSCSHSPHLSEQDLLDTLQRAARHLDRNLQVLCRLQQGPDHPVHPAVLETVCLKGFVCRVLPA